jgi:hypothetical protein
MALIARTPGVPNSMITSFICGSTLARPSTSRTIGGDRHGIDVAERLRHPGDRLLDLRPRPLRPVRERGERVEEPAQMADGRVGRGEGRGELIDHGIDLVAGSGGGAVDRFEPGPEGVALQGICGAVELVGQGGEGFEGFRETLGGQGSGAAP